jgi:hypothetical protein
MKVDAALVTGINAFGAHRGIVAQAFIYVEDIGRGDCLGKGRIYGLSG